MKIILGLVFVILLPLTSIAQSQNSAPYFRGRLGLNMLTFSVGTDYEKIALGSLITITPTILWNFPSFSLTHGFALHRRFRQ